MTEIIANGAITLIGIMVCYVLGYRKADIQQKTLIKNKTLPKGKCICTHNCTSHNFDAENREWLGCTAITKDNHTCACKHYVEDPELRDPF